MKEIKIEINIRALRYEELDEKDRKLIDAAKEATARSYAPYSRFSVGAAALLANGVTVTGTNQENAAYPSGTCAERTTLFYANSQYPDQPVDTLAIAARNESDFWSRLSRRVEPAVRYFWKPNSVSINLCESCFTVKTTFMCWKEPRICFRYPWK